MVDHGEANIAGTDTIAFGVEAVAASLANRRIWARGRDTGGKA